MTNRFSICRLNELQRKYNYKKVEKTEKGCKNCNHRHSVQGRNYCEEIARNCSYEYGCDLHVYRIPKPKKPRKKYEFKAIKIEDAYKCAYQGKEYYYRISDRGRRILIFTIKYNKLSFLYGLPVEDFKRDYENKSSEVVL